MKILQINKYYWPDIGGVETVVKQYAESQLFDGRVRILCVNKKFSLKTMTENINGVAVTRCSSFGTFFSMPISFSFYWHFFKLFKQYDILHFHEPFPLASLLSFLLPKKTKTIVTWHSDIINQKALKKFVELFQIKLCTKARIITTTSPHLAQNSSVLRKFPKKVKILPLGIDIKENVTELEDEGYILCIGRISYYKGIEVLLTAFELSKTNKKLVIVGDGDKRLIEKIRHFQTESKKAISFINRFVEEDEKNEFLSKCSFLVFPSTHSSEAFGIIQLEAMVRGKPVINTNLPTGVPFVSLNGITGLTVEPNNVKELSNAIDELSSDRNVLREMGKNALHRVKQEFSNDLLMIRLKDIYREML